MSLMEIVILALVVILAVRALSPGPHRRGIGILAVGSVLGMLLLGGLYLASFQVEVVSGEDSSVEDDNPGILQRKPRPEPMVSGTNSLPKVETLVDAEPVTDENGQVVLMRLSADMLDRFMGPDGRSALENINDALPVDIQNAYFMIPLPGSVGEVGPGIHALASAIGKVAEKTIVATESMEVAAAPTEPAEVPQEAETIPLPGWIEHPEEGHYVVTPRFQPTTEEASADLNRRVQQQLLEIAWREAGIDATDDVPPQSPLELTEAAVEACIVQRYQDSATYSAGGDLVEMQRTVALVQYPEAVQEQAVAHVRHDIRQQRLWTLMLLLTGTGVAVMLLAALTQVTSGPGRLKRILVIPMLLLVLAPVLLTCGVLTQRVVAGRAVKMAAPFESQHTIIDTPALSDPETTDSAVEDPEDEQPDAAEGSLSVEIKLQGV